jgi:hypothetical protein
VTILSDVAGDSIGTRVFLMGLRTKRICSDAVGALAD